MGVILCPPGDVKSLATALSEMCTSTELRDRLREETSRLALRLSWEKIGREYCDQLKRSDVVLRILVSNEFFYYTPGGADIILRHLIQAMISRGDSVTVCSFEKNGFIVNDPGLHHMNFTPYTPLDYSISALRSIDQFLEFDIIFAQHYYHFSSTFAALVSKRHHIPMVLKPIGIYGGNGVLRDLIYSIVERTQGAFSLKNSSLILPTTRFEANILESRGVPFKKLLVVPSGIDPVLRPTDEDLQKFRARFNIREQDRIVLFVGRVEKSKGVDVLIDSIFRLRNDFTNLRCLLVGPIETRFLRTLESTLRELDDRVILTGPLHGAELASSYYLSNIFCLPSRSELASLSIREAGRAGLPVVATNVGGNPEFVVDGKTGFLVPPEDAILLAEKIAMLLKDDNLREAMGSSGRDFSLAQTTEKYVKQTLDAIDSVLN